MNGTLFVVATPIGNLSDMTPRAVETLKNVDLVAAEDTRRTKTLLAHYGISKPVTSYFEHNEIKKSKDLLLALSSGKNIALVTDAGTPGISDPGFRLVKLARENGIMITPVPGVSALTAILSVSGLPTDEFTFKGFIPHPSAKRKAFFTELKERETTYVLYESARRLEDSLKDMREVLGDVDVVFGRELTKVHEEIRSGRVSDMLAVIDGRELKGEVALVVRTLALEMKASMDDATTALRRLLTEGHSLKDAVAAVTASTGMSRGKVYKEALKIKEE